MKRVELEFPENNDLNLNRIQNKVDIFYGVIYLIYFRYLIKRNIFEKRITKTMGETHS